MPLVRLEVRNEYRLGDPELYKGALKKDDPKALLDGVAVAGLVGILRQLGDLAEFAADVFHDLHEQVTVTAARGRKIMNRIQNIEAALPLVEKAIKGQTSHIHFSYVSGSDWHARLRDEQNLLLSSELPRFMMDSYEECHDPPRLYLLDKFDHAGAGACMKRYSDPSYFKRVWAESEQQKAENMPRERKVKKIKRKGSRLRNGEVPHVFYMSRHDSRTRFASPSIDDLPDIRLNSENLSRSASCSSSTKENYVEQTSEINPVVVPDELEYSELSISKLHIKDSGCDASVQHDEPSTDGLDDTSQNDSLQEQSIPRSSSVTWDEKTEIVKLTSPISCDDIVVDKIQDSGTLHTNCQKPTLDHAKSGALNQDDMFLNMGKASVSLSGVNHFDEVTSETDNYMDALNTLESETETEAEYQTKQELKLISGFSSEGLEPETVSRQELAMQDPDFSEAEALNVSDTSLKKESSQILPNLSPSDSSGQAPSDPVDSVQNKNYSVINDSSESNVQLIMEKKVHEGNDDGFSHESAISISQAILYNDAASKTSPEHASPTTSVMPSIHLWTNAGLFGVQPSKPPDLGALSTANENSVYAATNSASDFSSYTGKAQTLLNEFDVKTNMLHRPIQKEDSTTFTSPVHGNSTSAQLPAEAYTEVQPNDSPKHSSFCHDSEHNDMNVRQAPQVRLQRPLSSHQFDKTLEEPPIGYDTSSSEQYMVKNSVGRGAPSTDSESRIYRPGLGTKGISSSFSDLAQRFLANTLQRKPSLTNVSSPTSYGMSTANISKSEETSRSNNHKEVVNETATRESLKKSASSSSNYSEQSSPPLEHMKISFHPMNSLEMSKLKLEFSNGSLHENSEDFILPSFHLLQGHVQNSGSESDDDTFCRSSPYSSDDLLSPRSYSNSELWEQDERNGSMDYELFDTSHRISLKLTSFSGYEQNSNKDTSREFKNVNAQNSIIAFQSESSVDLPGLDTVLSLRNLQEGSRDFLVNDPVNSEVHSSDLLPPPPPPPPTQLRTLKQFVPSEEDNSANNRDGINHLNDRQTLRYLSKQQEQHELRTASISEQDQRKMSSQQKPHHHADNKEADKRVELFHQMRNEQHDQHKLNENAKPNIISTNGRELDEREELLHQIRNKIKSAATSNDIHLQSFNLRRTTMTGSKASLPRSKTSVSNGNVAAMLEKATAIRQAFVGSDEGGDEDNWSDG